MTMGNYLVWPDCRCGTVPAPLYPPEGFYGDLDNNPQFAAELVQNLADQFYGGDYLNTYGNGPYNHTRSHRYTGRGEPFDSFGDEPLCSWLWLNTDGDLEGASTVPPFYTTTDFPITGSGFDLSYVTMANCTNSADVLKRYINTLTFVLRQMKQWVDSGSGSRPSV